MSFKPDDAKAQDEAIRAMENCIEDLRNWLIEGRLLLNDDKTEFLVIGTRQQLNKLYPSVLHVGDDTIDPSVKEHMTRNQFFDFQKDRCKKHTSAKFE